MRAKRSVRLGERWCAHNDAAINELISDPQYRVFENGEIHTCRDLGGHHTSTWRRCDTAQTNGYRRVRFRGRKLSAHRIIYRRFLGILDAQKHINHIDGDGLNNHVSNLELVTPSENQLHSVRVLGNKPPLGMTKIGFAQAEIIRQLYKNGFQPSEIAERYSLSKSTISYILNGKSWKVPA